MGFLRDNGKLDRSAATEVYSKPIEKIRKLEYPLLQGRGPDHKWKMKSTDVDQKLVTWTMLGQPSTQDHSSKELQMT